MTAAQMAVFLEKHRVRLAVFGSQEWHSLAQLIDTLRQYGDLSLDALPQVKPAKAGRAPAALSKKPAIDPKVAAQSLASALRGVRDEPAAARALLAKAERTLTAPVAKQLARELNLGAAKTKGQALAKVQGWITSESRLRDIRKADMMAE